MTDPEPDPGDPPDVLPAPDRMVAFTDAAVAIALTLLVLPLVDLVPEAVAAGESPVELVTGNLPVFGSFLLSFVVIARYWVAHHRLFAFAGRLTPVMVGLNVFWILTIAVLPFLTEVVASYRDAVVVRSYIGLLLLCSATLTLMTVLMRRTALAGGGGGPPEVRVVGALAATANIALAFVVVLVAPVVGYYALLLLFLDPLTTSVVRRLRRARR